jgi:hypothetical protein
MGFHKFLRATIQGQPITLFGDGERRATSRSSAMR